jgi:peptidyl-tRNA hydrolase, PTH1 family
MFLIVGLGNPGAKYRNTRHNAGFIAIDILSEYYNFSWSSSPKFSADIASGQNEYGKIILCKPNTFMNLSGNAVQAIASYYKIAVENIIVIQDDIELDFAKIKCKVGGSSAGHNGIKSIDEHIGKNYLRIRLGVGRPDRQHVDVSNFVLSDFSKEQRQILVDKSKILASNMDLLLSNKLEEFRVKITS